VSANPTERTSSASSTHNRATSISDNMSSKRIIFYLLILNINLVLSCKYDAKI